MSEEINNTLIQRIESAWPLARWDGFRVVVAVSGGADSIALLRALSEIKKQSQHSPEDSGSLIVAHFNHRLRGSESDKDAEFVKQLARKLGLEFHCGTAADNTQSESENSLRDERYRFLVDVARQTNSRYVATAHHRDDQVETVLFRLFRGTGVNGLCGIPTNRVVDESLTIVRPMLEVDRTAIEEALTLWDQPWRDDATNAQSQYSRNFIRNEILPLLRERFPDVDASIARLSGQASQQQHFLNTQLQPLLASTREDNGAVIVECQNLREQPVVLLRELFVTIYRQQSWPTSQMGFRELDRLASLVVSDTDEPRFQLPGAINCEMFAGKIRLWKT